jgi:hypothetical protein
MRLMTGLTLLACVAVLMLAQGCGATYPTVRGSGVVATQARDAVGFHAIEVSGFGDVRIEQTGSESVVIEAEDNLLPLLVAEVNGGRLKVGTKPNINLRPTRPVIFHVTVSRLEAVEVSGSGDIKAPRLQTPSLTCRISGSGSLRVDDLDAERVDSRISGSGDVRLAGRADDIVLHVSGSGTYHAGGLRCRNASVAISGSGDATVNASRSLTADVSGSGSIRYLGEPSVEVHVSGSGSVSKS